MMDPNNPNPPDPEEVKRNEAYQKVMGRLMNNAFVLNDDNQRNEARNGHQALLLKISKSNEKLKRANRRLKKKIITRQKLLASYELRLAKSVSDLFAMRKELAKLKEMKETDNGKIEKLMCDVKRLKRKLLLVQKMDLDWDSNEFSLKVKDLKQEIHKVGNIKISKDTDYLNQSLLFDEKVELQKIEEENKQYLQSAKSLENRIAKIVPRHEKFEMEFMKTEHLLSGPSKTSE